MRALSLNNVKIIGHMNYICVPSCMRVCVCVCVLKIMKIKVWERNTKVLLFNAHVCSQIIYQDV